MDDLLKWLPVILAAVSAIAVIVTVRVQQRFSEWRDEKQDQRLDKHETALTDHNGRIRVLEDRTERT